jgi:hypothetical protein
MSLVYLFRFAPGALLLLLRQLLMPASAGAKAAKVLVCFLY